METERYLTNSAKVETHDIDWTLARRVGLTEDERFVLTYFADIEWQTVIYLRDFLNTTAALEPDVLAFLSVWNYEEFFHGRALARLMAECGCPLEKERIVTVRHQSQLSEPFEAMLATLASRVFRNQFPALYMTWGASQEITALQGYEHLRRMTPNPALKLLCERIAKQERRHFAWYFNSARERLAQSRTAQKLTKTLLQRVWSPVGAGVKSGHDVFRLIHILFPADKAQNMAQGIDRKIASLPGLEGMELMGPFIKKTAAHFQRLQRQHKTSEEIAVTG